jgi:PAS domain S-box-containing protein
MGSAIYILFVVVIILGSLVVFGILRYRKHRTEDVVPQQIEWLSVSREQFKRLFEEAPVPYFILTKKGEIKDLNKAGLRFFGVNPSEILMKNLFSLAADDDVEYAGYLATCCANGIPIDKKEIRMVTKSGDMRWIQLSVVGISERDSVSPSSLATAFDITEQKNLDKAKSEFVSLASHQLRTPIVTIKWNTEMLTNPNSGELNPKQQGYVRIISDVTADMVELVDTLLNISRIEVGKIAVELVATNVQALTESILTELSAQIEKKKLNIVRQYNDMFTGIQSDQRLLRIVIHNLITNAVKYTPDGGTISVAFKIEQNRNQIVVSDTGYGIPKNQQDKIFTKMFRADNVKDISSAQSTGLGLYMVKSLMANMGGDISFQSEENKGSSFTITL